MTVLSEAQHTSNPRKKPRHLRGDEYYVASAYQDHAKDCLQCVDPFRYRLCQKGRCLARDLTSYLRKDNGRFFAVYNHCHDGSPEVDLPRGFDTVHWLLAAIEDDKRFHPPSATTSCFSSPRPHDSVEIIERRPKNQEAGTQVIQITRLLGKKKKKTITVARRRESRGLHFGFFG